MKKVLFILFVVSLLFLLACESEEDKAARLESQRIATEQWEKERLEREEQAKLDRIEKEKQLQLSINACEMETDEDDQTFCLAEQGAILIDDGKKYGIELCNLANNSKLCKYYLAITKNEFAYCPAGDLACELATNPLVCNRVSNQGECKNSRAELISLFDRDRALKICSGNTCAQIHRFEESNNTLREKVTMVYFMSELGGYTIETVRR